MSIISGFSSERSNIFDPLSLSQWDPLHRCPFLKDLLSVDVASPPSPSRAAAAAAASMVPAIDWRETRDAHVIKVDLPGLKKQDVTIEIEDGQVLHIGGGRRRDEEEEGDTWHRMERGRGVFRRRLRLPEDAKTDEVKAAMEDGVLTITVPKVEVKKPEVKTIEIQG